MVNDRTPTVRVYVREKGGKRNFHPAPRNPDLAACYWLRYEKDGRQTWQRVGHYDLVAREKLLLERRLSAQAQGFILPEDHAVEKTSGTRVTVRAAVDAYLESLRIKNRPKKTISGKTYELGLFTASCKKSCMDELASADMLGFRDYLRSETYAERTVYNYLMTTTTFLKKNGLYKIVGLLEAEDWPEVPPTEPEPYTEGLCTNPNSFCYPVDVGPLHVRHFLFATTCAYENRMTSRSCPVATASNAGNQKPPPELGRYRFLKMRGEGQSLRQIAENLGVGYGTVRERLTGGERKTPGKMDGEKPPIKDT